VEVNSHFNDFAGGPLSLDESYVNSASTAAEAFEFVHEHFELERFILQVNATARPPLRFYICSVR